MKQPLCNKRNLTIFGPLAHNKMVAQAVDALCPPVLSWRGFYSSISDSSYLFKGCWAVAQTGLFCLNVLPVFLFDCSWVDGRVRKAERIDCVCVCVDMKQGSCQELTLGLRVKANWGWGSVPGTATKRSQSGPMSLASMDGSTQFSIHCFQVWVKKFKHLAGFTCFILLLLFCLLTSSKN